MKVFISHTFFDEDLKLAEDLQRILEKAGIDGYLAETKKKYDELIRDKIIDEIKNSDHMIAILTEKSFDSASVNQELGYALREGIRPIIMLEKNTKQGVLTFGIDPEEFTKETFEDSCKRVLTHIQEKGLRPKTIENWTQLSEKFERLESKINNQKPQIQMGYSDKNPEVQWYNEIVRWCDEHPYLPATHRKNAKEYYSQIQLLRQEISEISDTYEKASSFQQRNIAPILKSKRYSMKTLLNLLRGVWTNAS